MKKRAFINCFLAGSLSTSIVFPSTAHAIVIYVDQFSGGGNSVLYYLPGQVPGLWDVTTFTGSYNDNVQYFNRTYMPWWIGGLASDNARHSISEAFNGALGSLLGFPNPSFGAAPDGSLISPFFARESSGSSVYGIVTIKYFNDPYVPDGSVSSFHGYCTGSCGGQGLGLDQPLTYAIASYIGPGTPEQGANYQGGGSGGGADVPGPLPIFGASAAFAYSRKLRMRMSLSQSQKTASDPISSY